MFGGMAYKIGVLAKKATGGGGADVTPNAVNWADVYYNGMSGSWLCSERQITGIDTTITLKITSTTADGCYVFVSNTAGAIVSGDDSTQSDPSFLGMTFLDPNDTFTVSNNQYVTFTHSGASFNSVITVANQSDGAAVLDTFNSDCVDC
jgi:hypothetical protein